MKLETRIEPSGLRHYLAGRPVHAGEGLEVCLSGFWVPVRYEWNFSRQSPPMLFAEGAELRPYSKLEYRWPAKAVGDASE